MIFVCISSFLGGAVGAFLMAQFGASLGFVDLPNERSSHRKATPRGGGIGIAGAFLIASILSGFDAYVWIPLLCVAALSLAGDRVELAPLIRLPLHFLFAVLMMTGVWNATPATTLSFLVSGPFWAIFVVGTANFYNFMDGINGIAAVTGATAFSLTALQSMLSGAEPQYLVLSLSMAAACLGFLPFNCPNAKVFMGDIGSVLLGFVFAGLVVFLSKNLLDFICLAGFLFPFYADELTTMALRIRDGENLFRPHRRHVYQILANEKGIAHWKISVGYGLFQTVVGLSIIAVKSIGLAAVISLLGLYGIGFLIFSMFVRRNAVYPREKIEA